MTGCVHRGCTRRARYVLTLEVELEAPFRGAMRLPLCAEHKSSMAAHLRGLGGEIEIQRA